MKNQLIAMATAAALLSPPSMGTAEELTASIFLPSNHPLARFGYEEWAKRLADASKGDLEVRVVAGGALLPAAAHLSGLRDGIADVTQHPGTYTPSEIPEDNALSIMGFVLDDIVVAAAAVTDFYVNDPAMQKMFEKAGVVFLSANSTPAYNLICSSEVKNIAQMKGKKVRIGTTLQADFVRDVGGAPISAPSTEMYSGLEKGQLDCTVQAADDLRGRSLWDVAKHVTTLNLGNFASGWLHAMNPAKWASLTPEQRRQILQSMPETLAETMIEYRKIAAEVLELAPSKGVTVTEPADDLQDALKEFSGSRVKEAAIKEGDERFGLSNTADLVARFEAAVAKWDGILSDVDKTNVEQVAAKLREQIYDKIDVNAYGL